MKLTIVSPTQAILTEYDPEELSLLRHQLTYTNTSVKFLIGKHSKNQLWKNRNYDSWKAHLDQLQQDLKKCLVFEENGQFYIRPGSIPYLDNFNLEIDNQIKYPTPKKLPWLKPLPFTLHPYQEESWIKLLAEKHGNVEICTGGGKTATIFKLIRELGVQSVIVTPSSSIFNEILEKAEFHFGKKLVGAYGDGKKKIGKKITVAISKSLSMLKPGTEDYAFFNKAEAFLGDECFPYRTKILTDSGPKEIGNIHKEIQAGRLINVLSFNEKLGVFEFKKVTNSWQREQKNKLIKFYCSTMSFICTENHPLLTNNGWKKAIDILESDLLLKKRGKKSSGNYSWDHQYLSYGYTKISKKEIVEPKKRSNYQRIKNYWNLFDLEVEDNHNFVVGNKSGIVAHNCHTLPAESLEEICHGVLAPCPYRFFFSGTSTRNDGSIPLLQSIIGKTVHELSTAEAIQNGYISTHDYRIIAIESSNPNIQETDPLAIKRAHFLNNKNIAVFAARLANAMGTQKKGTLILVEELSQISMILPLLKVPYAIAHSEKSKARLEELGLCKVDNQESVEKLNRNEVQVLIGTSCIATGTNIYNCHAVVNWVGGSSPIKTKQGSVGRAVRHGHSNPWASNCVPKDKATIYDFDISDNYTLSRHLEARIACYQESGTEIKYLRLKKE